MSRKPSGLPDYESPPVAEVAIAIQFDPLDKIRTTHLGLLWSQFRDRFPKVEEHPPRDSAFESFEPAAASDQGPQVEIVGSPQVPRTWFLTEDEAELIQVQQDRFVFNWRRRENSDEYPHYEHVRSRFKSNLKKYIGFLEEENLGRPEPNQCELTYINHIESGSVWSEHSEVGKVIPSLTPKYSDSFLGEPEDVRAKFRYRIPAESGDPQGRLHIHVEPAFKQKNLDPVLKLRLTARGLPADSSFEGAFSFLDTAHRWIVRGFTSITSTAMHQVWERKDA